METVILVSAQIWHVWFLILAGLLNAFELFDKMKSYDFIEAQGTDIPISYGFKIMSYGVVVGSVNYVGGVFFKNYTEAMFKLVSFFPSLSLWQTTKSITHTTVDYSGYETRTKVSQKLKEVKRDFFELGALKDDLPIVYYLLHFLGLVCPFLIIAQAEIASITAITLITLYL